MEQKLTNQNETFGLYTPGNAKVDTTHTSVLDYMDAYDKTDYLYRMDWQ